MFEIVERFRNISMQELIQRGYVVKFVKFNSQRCFLIDKHGYLDNAKKSFPVLVEECKKTPPLKQVMDSQMGKIPQRYTRTKVLQYAVVLRNPSGGKYPAYEIVK